MGKGRKLFRHDTNHDICLNQPQPEVVLYDRTQPKGETGVERNVVPPKRRGTAKPSKPKRSKRRRVNQYPSGRL